MSRGFVRMGGLFTWDPPDGGMGTDTFGYGSLALAVVLVVIAAVQFRHEIPRLAALGVATGVVLAGIGGLTLAGKGYGFDADRDRPLLGLVTVFGTVAGFGLVVTSIMLLIG